MYKAVASYYNGQPWEYAVPFYVDVSHPNYVIEWTGNGIC